MKILFITQTDSAEYAISQLYYGALKLGHEVCVYPFNPYLNFKELKDCNMDCKNGPCSNPKEIGCLNHPAHICSNVNSNLEAFTPDITITNNGYGQRNLYLLPKIQKSKIVALDLGDSLYSAHKEWAECIGRQPDVFYRRELLSWQPGLPFDYTAHDDKFIFKSHTEMKYSVAFMHRPTNPERQRYLDIVKRIPKSIYGQFDLPEYLKILSESYIGVALPGAGHTTVRHAEIPSQGAILARQPWPAEFAQRLENPYDILFNSVGDFEFKITKALSSNYIVRNREQSFQWAKENGTCSSMVKRIIKECNIQNS